MTRCEHRLVGLPLPPVDGQFPGRDGRRREAHGSKRELAYPKLDGALVLFVIDLQTRRVQIGGVVRQAYGAWMVQVARNLTDGVDGFLLGKRYLIHDRDPLFSDEFRGVLAAAGVKCLRLPARSPNLNSVAERFVLSIKSECLSKLVPLGESHLRRAVSEYVMQHHGERNHQGVGNRLLTTAEQPRRSANSNAPVERRERLGGLLNFYYRRAA